MSRYTSKHGRPDTPLEAARRATYVGETAIVSARAYLIDPKGQDSGRDLSHLVEMLDEVLADLEKLRGKIVPMTANGVPPEVFFETMQRVDQAFIDVIVHSHIEDWKPILHTPQEEVRQLVRAARGD